MGRLERIGMATVAVTLASLQGYGQGTKLPVSISSFGPVATKITPMPLGQRVKRGIVPVQGLVSTGGSGGTLLSGDGRMMVELAGEPLNDSIIFHHERILQPWQRPFEAPKIAAVLPKVKRLILAGKYLEEL